MNTPQRTGAEIAQSSCQLLRVVRGLSVKLWPSSPLPKQGRVDNVGNTETRDGTCTHMIPSIEPCSWFT